MIFRRNCGRGARVALGTLRHLLCLASLVAATAGASPRTVNLEVEFARDPRGVDVPQPRLFWQLEDPRNGARQSAFQVLVASTREGLAAGCGDLWDSGRIPSDETTSVRYGGAPLRSSQQVFWKVRSWDRDGAAGEWSTPAEWTMGILQPGDWQARWIMAPGERLENTLLRREFTVRPGLRRAVVHVSGLGHYELFLNGAKAGDDLLAPGWSDYRDSVLYDTRDVTGLLRAGRNAVGLALGNGMLHVRRAEGRFAKFVGSFGPQRAILQLRLDYADGSSETLSTDETWRVRPGPITFSSIYGGEDHDARLEPPGWKLPGFADASWVGAVVAPDLGRLRGLSAAPEPVRAIETRTPVSVRELSPGVQLIDFGQNASFMPRIRVSGPAGSRVRLTGGELVNPDGTINRDSMGGAHRGSAWWQYTKATDGEETWFPQFYYVGSRYLYVETFGITDGADRSKLEHVEAVIVHSAAEHIGSFAASDPRLGRIRDLILWAQRSNMMSILTDCPHREKLGWLEQVHLNGPALHHEWDVTRLMMKAMGDMAEAQAADGMVPNIAPEYTEFKGAFRSAAEWGASFIAVPWQHYLFTGDTQLMRTHYEAMKRYFAFLEARASGGVLSDGLGDWYDIELGKGKRANLTPGAITATAHFFRDAEILAEVARVLGRAGDAAEFARKADMIRQLFRREFRKPGTKELYGSGSDTSLALVLAMDLVEPSDRDAVLKALVQAIERRGYPTSGAVGYRYLLQALTQGGRSDLILKAALNPEVPGYSYQLKQGATALAESWNAAPGASQNHFFLGQILEWFHACLAGLAPDAQMPGFRRMIVRPHPVAGLDWVEASHESLHGRHFVRWERCDGRFTLRVIVPANTSALVCVPGADAASAGLQPVRREGDRTVFEVPAGSYEFTSKL